MDHYFTNNENLKSEVKVIKYHYNSSSYEFLTDNGVFSKSKIDYGSKLLVETYLKHSKKLTSFLDVGCGYGFISIVLSKELNVAGLGIDINKRALKLASKNAQQNQASVSFKESNIYENVANKYDLIITNPPIRAGKKVVLEILSKAQNYLQKGGEIWAVIRKDQGAKSIINELNSFYEIEIKEKSKGFYVFVLKNN